MNAVVDNDIILKAACYGLLDEFLGPSCESIDLAGVLGAAAFVTRQRAKKMAMKGNTEAVLARLNSFFSSAVTLEPTDQEGILAAEIEYVAQRCSVNLDSGESQLCAVVITRGIPLLLTGDKRAICALEVLLDADQRLLKLSNKVRCLEQLISIALSKGQGAHLKAAICAEPSVDKALSICFSCTTGGGDEQSFAQGIESYITTLRSNAGRLLTV